MIRLERVEPRQVRGALLRELGEVWTWVTPERVREILPRHVGREGFRLVTARDDENVLAGFSYGYFGGAGQWWHDIVVDACSPEARDRWLAPGHFELVELHVRASHRRQGVGGRLHDAVLEGLAGRTAVLSTQTWNEPALTLYRARGWRVIVPELRFTGGGDPYSVLALDV